jgi:hypothetical protein
MLRFDHSEEETRMYKRGALSGLAAVVLVVAQGQGLGQSGRGMDVAGVTLKLGTPRDKVVSQITRAGYKTLDLPSEGKYSKVAVTNRDLTDKVQVAVAAVDNDGVLYFRDGVLVRMYRQITDETSTGKDLAFALYATVQKLRSEGFGDRCALNTTEETSPETPGMEARTILLTCPFGDGSYSTTHIRWVTNERVTLQIPVGVFQELWREPDRSN